MSPEPKIITSEEMARKYVESNIESILHTFKPIEKKYRNFPNMRTEYYKDRKTTRTVLVRHFLKDEQTGKEEMCVTVLVHGGEHYMADRAW